MPTISRTIGRLPGALQPRTRIANRRPARAEVLVQSSQGEGSAARLRDISIYGCNLIGETLRLRIGMFISLRLSDSLTVQAIVRWIRDESCGVEFLRPIPSEEADWINELTYSN